MTKVTYKPRRLALREAAQAHGPEVPDPTPIEVPSWHSRPLTLREEMQRFIREEASRVAGDNGLDTFEDFDDFSDDSGEPDLTTPYTLADVEDEFAETLDGEPTSEDLQAAQTVAGVDSPGGQQPEPEAPISPTHGEGENPADQ